jgi:CRISPR-associated protein Cas1
LRRSIVITKPARLAIDRSRLSITQNGETNLIPLEDLDIVVLDHDVIDVTAPTLGSLASQGVVLLVSDERHLPCGYLVPLQNHSLMAQTLRGQIEASSPVKKQIWKAIVRGKILSQERLLCQIYGQKTQLSTLVNQVKSGDSTNCEGRAASIYFSKLFGDEFSRMRGSELELEESQGYRLINSMLNYGYAVLRASVSRAIVAAGLNPTLGVFHHHRNNPLALADDLMEPLRPQVDRRVLALTQGAAAQTQALAQLTPEVKRGILSFLMEDVWFEGKRAPLDTSLALYATEVRQYLLGETRRIQVPGA